MTHSAISWCGIVNNSVFAAVVRPKFRSTIYAMDRCIEGAMASAGSLIVGVLADKAFHFQRHSPAGGGHGGRRLLTNSTAMDGDGSACDHNNATALAKALFTTMGVPWILCFLAYTALHYTYSDDRDACAPFIEADTPRHTERGHRSTITSTPHYE